MIRVGMMGGIGSGKSFIAKLFKYPVFNADQEVNNVYRKNKNCYNQLKKRLPKFIKSFPIKKSELIESCLLYTSPSPRDNPASRMPSSA